MGVFLKYVPVVNRAPIDLTIRFDGQDMTLPPGPGSVPEIVLQHAKNQNPIMGSQDPYDPSIHGARYLLGVAGVDNCEPLSAEEWATHLGEPCRTDEKIAFADKYGNDPKAKQIVLGKGRKTSAGSRAEAGTAPKGEATFEARD